MEWFDLRCIPDHCWHYALHDPVRTDWHPSVRCIAFQPVFGHDTHPACMPVYQGINLSPKPFDYPIRVSTAQAGAIGCNGLHLAQQLFSSCAQAPKGFDPERCQCFPTRENVLVDLFALCKLSGMAVCGGCMVHELSCARVFRCHINKYLHQPRLAEGIDIQTPRRNRSPLAAEDAQQVALHSGEAAQLA